MRDYRDFGADLVRKAALRGADGADAYVVQRRTCRVRVRMGEVESLEEAGTEGVGLRVFRNGATALVHTTDLSPNSLDRLLDDALQLASVTDADPCNRLPERVNGPGVSRSLGIFDPAVCGIATERKVEMLSEMEEVGRAFDPRINNSNGAWWEDAVERVTLANSVGFVGQFDHSRVGMGVSLVAEQDGVKQTDTWSSAARSLAAVEPPADIGRKAAERVIRKLGARPVSTQTVPVVFDPVVAEDLLGILVGTLNGMAIFRRNSFLVGKLGQRIGNRHINIVDDGIRAGGLGTRPFDGEGVPTRRTEVIREGVLRSYLCDTYTAGKLHLPCTGNASRTYDVAPGVGPTNFYLEPGAVDPGEIIRSVDRGLLVTRLYWVGTNLASGDYSRGAEGIWIEHGSLTHPVQEVTIAGNVLDMLQRIEVVGSDLEFRGTVASPTLLLSNLVLSGH